MRRVVFALALSGLGLAVAGSLLNPRQGRAAQRDTQPATTQQPGDSQADPPFRPSVPQAWDEGTVANLQLPLAEPKHSPVEIPWEYYYRIPRRLIYKSYPVYAPGHEPAGYFEWLKQQEPRVVWGVDYAGQSHTPPLQTETDWIKAGEMVFDAPIAYDVDPWGASVVSVADVRNPAWYENLHPPMSSDGVLPFARYVIRKRGVVELGQQSCGMCHTRALPDGTVAKGAQGNFPFDRAAGWRLEELGRGENRGQLLATVRKVLRSSFDAPWLNNGFGDRINGMSLDEIADALSAIPSGMTDRRGSSLFHPVQTPDLIGVRSRTFLDHTGLVRQRSIGDLMSYAALNQDVGGLARYSGFIPEGVGAGTLPDPVERVRYSDEQLYALALYLYSFKAPPNPNQL